MARWCGLSILEMLAARSDAAPDQLGDVAVERSTSHPLRTMERWRAMT